MAGSVVDRTASCVRAERDGWLSDVCRCSVVRIAGDWTESVNGAAVEQAVQAADADFAFAKVDAKQVAAAAALQDAGFRVVDVGLTLAMAATDAGHVDVCEGVSRLAKLSNDQANEHPLAEVAGSSFRFSRFHLDPSFSDELADEIKRQWVVNYLRGNRGDAIWGATVDGRWAGFLAAIKTADGRAAVIDLIGVAPEFQGRGVGRSLITHFQHHFAGEVETLRVGTQAANHPSLRLYEKMGFRFEHAAYVLHWSREGRRSEV